jgi:hypothetical protein
VGVQEVRWEKKALKGQRIIHFYGKGNEDHQLGTGFSYIIESYQQLGE